MRSAAISVPFNLTDEPVEEPSQRLDQELHRLGIDRARFHTLKPGEGWTIPVAARPVQGDRHLVNRADEP